MKRVIICILLVGICVAVTGCKAPPKKTTDFVEGEKMEKREDLPFHSVWVKEGFDKSQFDKVYVAPVNVSYIFFDDSDWWKNSFKSYNDLKKDAEDMGNYMRESFKKAFTDDPNKRMAVVEEPDNSTLVVELALTELTPNKPYLKIARFAPFGAGAAVTLLNQTNLSTVSFESRIRNGRTGEVVAMFADREQEKKYLLTVKNLTWYSHAEEIVNDWAHQFVEIANREDGEMVKDSATFGLKPW